MDLPTPQFDLAPDTEGRRPTAPNGQTLELGAFAEAVRALGQVKGVIAGRCTGLLGLPIDRLLDVVDACHTWLKNTQNVQSDDQDEGDLGRILSALVVLDGRADLALVILNKLSMNAKRTLAQARSPTGISRANAVEAIRSAAQDFIAMKTIHLEDIVALWAPYELEKDYAPSRRSSPSGLVQELAVNAPHPDGSFPSSSPGSEESQSVDEVVTENSLGDGAFRRLASDGSIDHLHEAIDHFKKALVLCSTEHSLRFEILRRTGYALFTRFHLLQQIEDLQHAITHLRGTVDLRSEDAPDRHFLLNDLAHALELCFGQLGQSTNLQEAVTYRRACLKLRPLGHPDRAVALISLAAVLQTHFAQLGQMADLEQSIIYGRDALELCPPGNPYHSSSLNHLATALKARFDHLGQMPDLQQSISYQQETLKLCPQGHPDRHFSLCNLASALYTRFNQLGQMADLKQSIAYDREGLKLCPPGHPDRSTFLNNLASSLKARFAQQGHIKDLDKSIVYQRDGLKLRPPGHPRRHSSLGGLALTLAIRFAQSGQIADLEQSIIYEHDALELRPPSHPDRSTSLNNLAGALRTRFNQYGQMEDLEKSIMYQRDGLKLCPPGHPDRHFLLANLAGAFETRFDYLGRMEDLEQSIIYGREALELRPLGNPHRANSLSNLTIALKTRFSRLGLMEDLEQSVIYGRDALELCPPGHPDRYFPLNNLAASLEARFDKLGLVEDLEQSIIYGREALGLCPPGHPDRFVSLNTLSHSLATRFMQSGRIEDLNQAIELPLSGANDASDTPAHRYTCVSQLIELLEPHRYPHPLLLEVYQIALNLLQLVLAVYPDIELRRTALGTHRLSPSLAMSAAAHAIRQGQPEKAIEMLEQGRSMLWSNIRGYREPVEGVRQVNAALADRFKSTSEQLEALATSSQRGHNRSSDESHDESIAVSEARWARQRHLLMERDEIIQQIRQLDGFQHFLEAVPFSELQNAAAEGPVIIVNVAQRRSDAIVLYQNDAPIILPLCADEQSREESYLAVLNMSKLLFERRGMPGFSKTLQDNILKALAKLLVTPVLQGLERLGVPQQSRIWWCPTSALCALPIHAAGELPNKYISSYTPTLSALIGARKAKNQQPPTLNGRDRKPSLLAVIHPGHPPKIEGGLDDRLLTVFTECNVIEKTGRDSQVRDVVRTEAARQQVLDKLPLHPWVHFACHGRLNTSEPFKSHFELDDHPLSLSDLIQARLPNADFAFLAACDSATSGGTSSTPDESLHLAAAVQFCGVHSVVGTLWPMADVDGPRMAQVFYRHMFKGDDPRRSAEALHKAVTAMSKKTGPWKKTADEGELLQRWANYVHIGA
ncbi:hypothetical protein HWV62_43373 [Athelia sp. TMB]|nr:hypothetical protein HWV62_43373 [Athelia sp. TMB]